MGHIAAQNRSSCAAGRTGLSIVIARVLLQGPVGGTDNVAMEREDKRMVVGIGRFVPPCTQELVEPNEVYSAATFSKELAPPLVQQLFHVELGRSFGLIES